VKKAILSTLALGLAACVHAGEPAPVSGIDLRDIDASVRPQDDFYTYLNGAWLKSAQIPADKASWGTFMQLRDETTPQLRALIEADQADPAAGAGGEARKIADLYASFMDQARLEERGYKPLTGELARIRMLRDKKAIPALIAHLAQLGVALPYALSVAQDSRASTRYAAYIGQSGLGLPDRDYYLKLGDAKLAAVRARYQAHIETMLAMVGAPDAGGAAAQVLALETALAEAQWTRVENRDPVKRYNKVDRRQLAALTPAYDWGRALAAAGVANKTDDVIVSQPSYLAAFDRVLGATSLEAWKAYFEWQLVRAYAPYLSARFVDADFAFYGTVLTGAAQNQPRWKRGVAVVEGALGEALGKQYVARYFPPERKARMQTLVANLLAAYKASIDTLDWMSPATRQQAQAKLASFHAKIGYPDKWRDYAALSVMRDDLAGNVMRARAFAYARDINKLGKPVERGEWHMTPQTVNAYYNAAMNEIVFPASILQPPFFDVRADDAVNYGAIGAVIGHEISHGFDDKGSQFDGEGNLRDWWTPEDRAKFDAKAARLTRQYDGYSPLPGYHVNGALTLGENIADNAGVAIAYKAYQLSLGGQAAPVIDGFTGAQRFFMGFGRVWRVTMREAQQIVQIKTDPHAPGRFRANGSMMNQPGFYEAFGVKPGDAMYLPPQERVTIW